MWALGRVDIETAIGEKLNFEDAVWFNTYEKQWELNMRLETWDDLCEYLRNVNDKLMYSDQDERSKLEHRRRTLQDKMSRIKAHKHLRILRKDLAKKCTQQWWDQKYESCLFQANILKDIETGSLIDDVIVMTVELNITQFRGDYLDVVTRSKVVTTLDTAFQEYKERHYIDDFMMVCDEKLNPPSLIDQKGLCLKVIYKVPGRQWPKDYTRTLLPKGSNNGQ